MSQSSCCQSHFTHFSSLLLSALFVNGLCNALSWATSGRTIARDNEVGKKVVKKYIRISIELRCRREVGTSSNSVDGQLAAVKKTVWLKNYIKRYLKDQQIVAESTHKLELKMKRSNIWQSLITRVDFVEWSLEFTENLNKKIAWSWTDGSRLRQ